MRNDIMDYNSFRNYIKNIDISKRDIANAWNVAIGLQAVDGLKVSEFLLDTAVDNIEGKISMEEAEKRIENYYSKNRSKENEEND